MKLTKIYLLYKKKISGNTKVSNVQSLRILIFANRRTTNIFFFLIEEDVEFRAL